MSEVFFLEIGMHYAVVLGSDWFIGTDGTMWIQTASGPKEFIKIDEIDRKRSSGSYLVPSCTIRDVTGTIEVKLEKGKIRAAQTEISVQHSENSTEITRVSDGSRIIKFELLPHDPTIQIIEIIMQKMPWLPPEHVESLLKSPNLPPTLDEIIRITGSFVIPELNNLKIQIDVKQTTINGNSLHGNISLGGRGLWLSKNGFAF